MGNRRCLTFAALAAGALLGMSPFLGAFHVHVLRVNVEAIAQTQRRRFLERKSLTQAERR